MKVENNFLFRANNLVSKPRCKSVFEKGLRRKLAVKSGLSTASTCIISMFGCKTVEMLGCPGRGNVGESRSLGSELTNKLSSDFSRPSNPSRTFSAFLGGLLTIGARRVLCAAFCVGFGSRSMECVEPGEWRSFVLFGAFCGLLAATAAAKSTLIDNGSCHETFRGGWCACELRQEIHTDSLEISFGL